MFSGKSPRRPLNIASALLLLGSTAPLATYAETSSQGSKFKWVFPEGDESFLLSDTVVVAYEAPLDKFTGMDGQIVASLHCDFKGKTKPEFLVEVNLDANSTEKHYRWPIEKIQSHVSGPLTEETCLFMSPYSDESRRFQSGIFRINNQYRNPTTISLMRSTTPTNTATGIASPAPSSSTAIQNRTVESPSSQPSQDMPNGGSQPPQGISTGAIVGIAITVIFAVGMVLLGIRHWRRRRTRRLVIDSGTHKDGIQIDSLYLHLPSSTPATDGLPELGSKCIPFEMPDPRDHVQHELQTVENPGEMPVDFDEMAGDTEGGDEVRHELPT